MSGDSTPKTPSERRRSAPGFSDNFWGAPSFLSAIRTRKSSGELKRKSRDDRRRRSEGAKQSPSAWDNQKNGPPVTLLEDMAMRADGHGLNQGLSSILNAPDEAAAAASGSTGWYWPFGLEADLPMVVPPPDPHLLPPVSLGQFEPYLIACGNQQHQFQTQYDAKKAQEAAKVPGKAFGPGDGLVEALKTVPLMHFDEDFSLARQETWQQVVTTEDDQQRLARLEEYSSHIDTVEAQISREIAALQAHSTQFFETSTLLQDLRGVLQRAFAQVHSTRRILNSQKKEMQQAASHVTSCKRRRANLEVILEFLKTVEEVASAQQALALLLPQGDFSAALDVVDSLAGMVKQHKTTGLKAFHGLEDSLLATGQAIEELLLVEFLRVAKVPRWSYKLTSKPTSEAAHAPEMRDEGSNVTEMEDELTPIVECLQRTDSLEACIAGMQSEAASSIKAAIRDTVEEALRELAGKAAQKGVSQQLQILEPEQFLALLSYVRGVSIQHMQHVRLVHRLINGLLKRSKASRTLMPACDAEFQLVLQSVSEAAHGRWIKLLASRSDVVNSLSIEDLVLLQEASLEFGNCMQELGAKPTPALKNAVHVASALDRDLWASAEATSGQQRILDELPARCAQKANGVARDDRPPVNIEGRLQIGGHSFINVRSLGALLDGIGRYLQYLDSIPSLAPEISHRIVELIKVYNSRMCQLVLGAGAMQTTGLKSITAKHLAISCQLVALLKEVQACLAGFLPQALPLVRRRMLVSELNLLAKDLAMHRSEVHSKLVGIMRERLIASLRQLPVLASRWTTGPSQTATPSHSPEPSAFAASLIKQLRTLSQVLTQILTEEEVHIIFGRIAALYSKNLAEAFSRLDPRGLTWELQCRADLKHLLAAIEDLPTASASPQDSSSERLRALLSGRFGPITTDSTLPLSSLSHQQPLNGSSRSFVSRLGTAKMPFFKGNARESPLRASQDDVTNVRQIHDSAQLSDSQSPPSRPELGSDSPIDVHQAPETQPVHLTSQENQRSGEVTEPAHDELQHEIAADIIHDPSFLQNSEDMPGHMTDGLASEEDVLSREIHASERQGQDIAAQPRETAESLLEKMENAVKGRRTFNVDSRSASFADNLQLEATDGEPAQSEVLMADEALDLETRPPDFAESASLINGPEVDTQEHQKEDLNEHQHSSTDDMIATATAQSVPIMPSEMEHRPANNMGEDRVEQASRLEPWSDQDGLSKIVEPVDEVLHEGQMRALGTPSNDKEPSDAQNLKVIALRDMLKTIEDENWQDA